MQFRNYTETHDYYLRKEDGGYATLSDAMSVRVKIGRNDDAPWLDLASGTANANGSIATIVSRSPARVRLTISADDTEDVEAGIFDIETNVVLAGNVFFAQAGVLTLADGV